MAGLTGQEIFCGISTGKEGRVFAVGEQAGQLLSVADRLTVGP